MPVNIKHFMIFKYLYGELTTVFEIECKNCNRLDLVNDINKNLTS